MKTKHARDLPSLPSEVKAMVEDGVYALYEIDDERARYLLVTNASELYCLDESGNLLQVPGIRAVSDVNIVDAVVFERDADSVRINQR